MAQLNVSLCESYRYKKLSCVEIVNFLDILWWQQTLNLASIFFAISLTPVGVSQYPRYFSSWVEKSHFFKLKSNPALFSHFKSWLNFSRWSSKTSLVAVKLPSRQVRTKSQPCINSDIFCWNMSWLPVTPIGRRRYSYCQKGVTILQYFYEFPFEGIVYYPIFKTL